MKKYRADVGLDKNFRSIKSKCRNGTCSVAPYPGQLFYLFNCVRKSSIVLVVFIVYYFRRLMQKLGPAVVAEALPSVEHIGKRHTGKHARTGVGADEFFVVLDDALHLRLLEHHFRYQNFVRVARGAPRQMRTPLFKIVVAQLPNKRFQIGRLWPHTKIVARAKQNPALTCGVLRTAVKRLSLRAGVGDREHATAELFAVPHFYGGVGACIIRHLHKAEAPGAAGLAVSHDRGRGDLAGFGEGVAELVTCRAVRKTADKEFACH